MLHFRRKPKQIFIPRDAIRRDASDVAAQFIECKYIEEICVDAMLRVISGDRIISRISAINKDFDVAKK